MSTIIMERELRTFYCWINIIALFCTPVEGNWLLYLILLVTPDDFSDCLVIEKVEMVNSSKRPLECWAAPTASNSISQQ